MELGAEIPWSRSSPRLVALSGIRPGLICQTCARSIPPAPQWFALSSPLDVIHLTSSIVPLNVRVHPPPPSERLFACFRIISLLAAPRVLRNSSAISNMPLRPHSPILQNRLPPLKNPRGFCIISLLAATYNACNQFAISNMPPCPHSSIRQNTPPASRHVASQPAPPCP